VLPSAAVGAFNIPRLSSERASARYEALHCGYLALKDVKWYMKVGWMGWMGWMGRRRMIS
jgi:hypothetical protein